jgi:hypothetical protein
VFNLLLLALKLGGKAQKKNPQPCFEVPSSVLGVLGMVETKNIFSCPSIFDVKNS